MFGITEDPKTKKPRNWVELEDIIEALTKGKVCDDLKDSSVIRFYGERCRVTINKNEGRLIQTNPIHRKKE